MDPRGQFCHNATCPARGRVGEGNIGVHSLAERRYICRGCGQTFAETKGTPFYGLKKGAGLVTVVLTLLSHGCPVQAVVAAFGLDERTVADWQARGGAHCERVHAHLVRQGRVDLGHVQADELWAKVVGAKVWMAMALAVPYRLWLGGAISSQRDEALIRSLVAMVAACAASFGVLVCVDGLASYVSAFARAFRHPLRTGKVGRPRLVPDPGFLLGQVVKSYAKRRVKGVAQRAVRGTAGAILARLAATGGGSQINTSYIERLNATFRAHLAPLVRRGRALARRQATLNAGMYLVGCAYNFCWHHDSLRLPAPPGAPHKWRERTPAMAAGLTDHRWTMSEMLHYQIPLPAWAPPKRRGRPPKQPPTPALAVAA
jgi:transposase-like protein